jgi:hypothetical protein
MTRAFAESQTASSVLMVRPACFGANPETADSNRFQARQQDAPVAEIQVRARAEFDALAHALSDAGVNVCIAEDSVEPPKPDAVFPNNWVSFHADGTVVLYPMMAQSRRRERREDLLAWLAREQGFRIHRTVDLTRHESTGGFLEGTGSLALDRARRIAFACLSPRTHLGPLGDFAQQLDYEVVSFEAGDAEGEAIYHTNVLLCIGERFAVLCAVSIRDEARRAAVRRILEDSGHDLIDIDFGQLAAFAGNMLALRSNAGSPLIVLSAGALESLTRPQRVRLEQHGELLTVPIPTIEKYGGGSVRCMLAEIHLPRRS